jgi:heat shock protein HslJ
MDMYGMSGTCPTDLAIPWLDLAEGWRPDGPGVLLVDREGQEVVRLDPTTPPDDPAFAGVIYPDQASLSDEDRAVMNVTPSIGAGIAAAATRELLVGTWSAVPPESAPPDGGPDAEWPEAGIILNDDGTWSGTDGCNGGGGRWNADAGGVLIATLGPQARVGCNNIDAAGWLGSAFLAGFTADGTLVLLGYQGEELGRLTRA